MDKTTIEAYDKNAKAYQELFGEQQPSKSLRDFMGTIAAGGNVLDLGCGHAASSAFMQQAGFNVTAIDASTEMIKVAKEQYGIDVKQATFDDISGVETYHGIWANFSLLHADRDKMPAYLSALFIALKPNGVLHIGLKLGTGEKRDRLDRYYVYYSEEEICNLVSDAGFTIIFKTLFEDKGLAGTLDPCIILRAQKHE